MGKKKCKQWQTLFSWAPKSLRTVTAAMQLRDGCSSEEKLRQPNSVQFSRSVMSDSLQPRGLQHTRLPCLCQSLLTLMSIESVMPSNHLIFCHSLLLLPSVFPSIRVFSDESALRIRWPKDWSFSSKKLPILPKNSQAEIRHMN